MEQEKKTLVLSILVAVFFTAFIVSSVMFYFFYQKDLTREKEVLKQDVISQNLNQNGNLPNDTNNFQDSTQNLEQGNLQENNNLSNNPTDLGTDTLISKSAITWQEPKKVGDLGYFDDRKSCQDANDAILEYKPSEYFLVGKIIDGIYKNYDLYLVKGGVSICSNGPGMSNFTFKMLTNGQQKIFFKGYERFNDWEFDLLNEAIGGESQDKIINGNIVIEDLHYPEELILSGGKQSIGKRKYEDVFFTTQSYNILTKAFTTADGDDVWVTDRAEADRLFGEKKDVTDEDRKNYQTFNSNGFYIETADGSVVSYRLKFDSIATYVGEDDRVATLEVTWNDGQTRNNEYEMYPVGCGVKYYAYDFSNKVNVDKDLKVIGTAKNGDLIYGFENVNHSGFKILYEDIYHEKNGEKKSEEEFLKTHPQVFWIDQFDRVLSFYSTDIISPAECGKPVIYLYPEEEIDVQVQVFPGNGFTITDPEYGVDGWKVKARPNGLITNYADGKDYPYLFWEGRGDEIYTMPNSGFMIKAENLDKFFDDKLAQLGLNEQEVYDFKDFWIEKMQAENKKYYFVTFLAENFIHKLAPLKIDPKPDTVIRVLMDYQGLDNYKNVSEQKIITPERKGFTVVEWGGMLH